MSLTYRGNNSKVESKVESEVESKVESEVESKVESEVESEVESRVSGGARRAESVPAKILARKKFAGRSPANFFRDHRSRRCDGRTGATVENVFRKK